MMPRTLPAALTTVMDSGNYEPYIRAVVAAQEEAGETIQPLSYVLTATSCIVTFAKFTDSTEAMYQFRIVRGAMVNGTPETISTAWFVSVDISFNGKLVTLRGELLQNVYASTLVGSTYKQVIEAIIDNNGIQGGTWTYLYEGTAAWKSYQFYPSGEFAIFSPAKELFSMLKHKYLVFATENGFDGTNNKMFFFCGPQTRDTDYTITDLLFTSNEHVENRRMIYTDADGNIIANGNAFDPIHNFGFLPNSAAFPLSDTNSARNLHIGSRSSKLPVHLKYRTGDVVGCSGDGSGITSFSARVNVIEVLDLDSFPAWYNILETLQWFESRSEPDPTLQVWRPPTKPPGNKLKRVGKNRGRNKKNTESIPPNSTGKGDQGAQSTAAADVKPPTNLSQVTTGRFTTVLSENENTIQSAFEKLDKHAHSMSHAEFKEVIQDIIGDLLATRSNDVHDGAQFNYNDADAELQFQLDWDAIAATVPTTEQIQDIAGAMVSSNTEAGIAVTYQDSDGTIDFEGAQAETNSNVICSVSAPGGASAFAGTIATLPGGATLTYNVTSGQEGAMKPTASTQVAKMRLYNTTRGTSALISDVTTGTNTITLTANVPAGWQVGDVITIASQTISGGGYSWVDMEIVSGGPTGKSALFLTMLITSGAAADETVLHPFTSYNGAKRFQLLAHVAAVQNNGFGLVAITSNVFGWAWTANSTVITIREAGFIP